MSEDMLFGSQIPVEWITVFEEAIIDYVHRYKDNMIARNLLSRRTVGETVVTDVLMRYDEATTDEASIVGKGSVPYTFGAVAVTEKHLVYKFATAFYIDERDLKTDPKMHTRHVDIGMRKMHRLEDKIAINGSTNHGISGLVAAAENADHGRVVASGGSGLNVNNNGSWDGKDTEGTIDIFDDVLTGYGMMGEDFEPAYMLGRRTEMLHMFKLDSERLPYIDSIAGLLTGNEASRDWMIFSDYVPSGYVYLVAKDPLFAEQVHAIDIMVEAYPKQPGGSYMVELKEWLSPIQLHSNKGVVEIAIT